MRIADARRIVRAFPAAWRVGMLTMIAYRAEFVVWFLAYSMPLIMMALWTAVAREGPVGEFDARKFQAYFMAALLVRLVTGSWVAWELTWEVRQGTLAQRMLRPFPPLLAHFADQSSAMPMRLVLVSPILLVTFLWLGPGIFTSDPVQLVILPLSLIGSFSILFLVGAAIGSLALFWESSLSVMDLFLGFFMVLSGYVVPLSLFPPGIQAAVAWTPYPYMLAFPVGNVLGLLDRGESLRMLAFQWTWVAVLLLVCATSWRLGVRRFAAFGG